MMKTHFERMARYNAWANARARELGVKNIIVTHALTNVPGLTMAQAKQVVDMGAVIEVCFLQFQAGPDAPLAFLTHWTHINAKHIAQAVKEFGAMKREGISDADIDVMMRRNPA